MTTTEIDRTETDRTMWDSLVDVALHAPGRSGPRCAVLILDSLARDGRIEAALALARIVAVELELDASALVPERCPDFEHLVGLDAAPFLPAILAAGYRPTQLALDEEAWHARAREALDEATMRAFAAIVRRRGAAEDVVLRGYVTAHAVLFMSMQRDLGLPPGRRYRISVYRRAMTATVVSGSDTNDAFEVGRDLLVRLTPAGLLSVLGHELGHLWQDAVMAGNLADRGLPVEAIVSEVALALPGLLDRADVEPSGLGSVTTASGLHVELSRDRVDESGFVHLSASDQRGVIGVEAAAALAGVMAGLAGVDPGRIVLAHSPQAVVHLGLPVEDLDRTHIARLLRHVERVVEPAVERSAAWLATARHQGRVGASEADLLPMLGLSRPTLVAVDRRRAAADLRDCLTLLQDSALRDQSAQVLTGLTLAAVRSGNPAALRRLRLTAPAVVAAVSADAAVEQLGSSLAVGWEGTHGSFLGPSSEQLIDVVAELSAAGVDVGSGAGDDQTLLVDAARRSSALTAALLRAGVDVDARSAVGGSALASARGEEVARLLLEAGADVSLADGDGWTALHHAVERNDEATARLLIAAGASAAAKALGGETPLHLACSARMVDLLVGAGADVDDTTVAGETATMWAARRGDVATLGALLTAGADPHLTTVQGESALHLAAKGPWEASVAVIGLLLASGADPREESNSGLTALQVAEEMDNEAAAQALSAGVPDRGAPGGGAADSGGPAGGSSDG